MSRMALEYIEERQRIIFHFIDAFKQTGQVSFDIEDALETYKRERRDLECYLTGLFVGRVSERGLADGFKDILAGLNQSYKSYLPKDLQEPKRESFANLDLVEGKFGRLFAAATMHQLSHREYISRWEKYNQLFGEK